MYPHEINVFSKCIITYFILFVYRFIYYRHIATADITGFSPHVVEVFIFLGCYTWPLLLEN